MVVDLSQVILMIPPNNLLQTKVGYSPLLPRTVPSIINVTQAIALMGPVANSLRVALAKRVILLPILASVLLFQITPTTILVPMCATVALAVYPVVQGSVPHVQPILVRHCRKVHNLGGLAQNTLPVME